MSIDTHIFNESTHEICINSKNFVHVV